jgi:hypothetical protein
MGLPNSGNSITLLNNKELRAGEQIGFELTTNKEAVAPHAFCTADYYISTKCFDPCVKYNPSDPEMTNYELDITAGINGMVSNRGKYPQFQTPDMFGEDQRDWDGGVVETDMQTHNNEYESGYAQALMFIRTSRILPVSFSNDAYYLFTTNAFHHSTNDIYHVWEGDFHWMWFSPWQHPRHGGSGTGEPNRSSFPANSSHFNGRVDLLAYYFTGNPFMLKGYKEIMESVMWKVENSNGMPGISGTNEEDRAPANILALSLDWYQHLEGQDQSRIRGVIKRIIDESYASRGYVIQSSWGSPTWTCKPWMVSMLGTQYDRAADVFALENDAEMVTLCTNCRKGVSNFLANYCYIPEGAKPAHMPYQVGTTYIDASIDSMNLIAADAICKDYPVKAKELFKSGSTSIWYIGYPIGSYAKFNVHSNAMYWSGRYLSNR